MLSVDDYTETSRSHCIDTGPISERLDCPCMWGSNLDPLECTASAQPTEVASLHWSIQQKNSLVDINHNPELYCKRTRPSDSSSRCLTFGVLWLYHCSMHLLRRDCFRSGYFAVNTPVTESFSPSRLPSCIGSRLVLTKKHTFFRWHWAQYSITRGKSDIWPRFLLPLGKALCTPMALSRWVFTENRKTKRNKRDNAKVGQVNWTVTAVRVERPGVSVFFRGRRET